MRKLRVAVATTVTVGLLLAGCGDGNEDATEEVSTVTLDLLEGVKSAGTARIAMTFDGEQVLAPGQVLDASMHIEGVLDVASGDHDLAGSATVQRILPEGSVDPAPPTTTFSTAHRQVDGRSFGRWGDDVRWTDETSAPTADDEVIVEEDGTTSSVPSDAGTVDDDDSHALQRLMTLEDVDPVAALAEIRDLARTVTEEGRTDVRDTPATHYRAVVDEEVVDDLLMGPDAEPVVDVWVDDEDRLRRVEVDQTRIDLWDFGVDVDIQAPDEVVDWDSVDMSSLGPFTVPNRSGEWTLQAAGDASLGRWEVWAAPHEVDGGSLTCRTFEAGDVERSFEGSASWPNREGVPAYCGYGADWLAFHVPTLEPSLQAFVASTWSDTTGEEIPLVALVVDPRWAGRPVRVVRDGAPDVELAVGPGGVATWEPDGPAEPTEIWLADGEVRCDLTTFEEQLAFDAEEFAEEGVDPAPDDGESFPYVLSVSGCVRP